MDNATAYEAYGFSGGQPSNPSVVPETSVGSGLDMPNTGVKLPLHWGNPLFWLLVGVLIFTGWLYGGFNLGGSAGIRKIGSAGGSFKVRGGR